MVEIALHFDIIEGQTSMNAWCFTQPHKVVHEVRHDLGEWVTWNCFNVSLLIDKLELNNIMEMYNTCYMVNGKYLPGRTTQWGW